MRKLIRYSYYILLTAYLFTGCDVTEESRTKDSTSSSSSSSNSSETTTTDTTSTGGTSQCPSLAVSSSNNSAVNTDNESNSKTTRIQAHRLLTQATFGPTEAEMARVMKIGETAWIDEQLSLESSYYSSSDCRLTNLERYKEIAKMAEPTVYQTDSNFNSNFHGRTSDYQTDVWFENALHAPDQLRTRVAFALSELIVVSVKKQRTRFRGDSLAYFDDMMSKHAFGNYRDLIEDVSRSPTMGLFLSHQGNKKYDNTSNTHPDENYARELMQLFTMGLWEMDDNGTMQTDNSSNPIPSYTQDDVEELARVMTGYDLKGNSKFGRTNRGQGEEWSTPMEFTGAYHDYGLKSLLGENIPQEIQSSNKPYDLDKALDILFKHQNVAPHVSRHLIMRLVTSNPRPAYIGWVAAKFNDNGNGVRGDLKAAVRAVLIDVEARGNAYQTNTNYGKAKEPLLAFTQFLRAFAVQPLDGWKSRMSATITGVYQFYYLENTIGQSPLRSDTVFNFFSTDFVPADTHFDNNSIVAPELQIQSDTILIKFSNLILNSLWTLEKNRILEENPSLETFAAGRKYNQHNYVINLDRELQVLENSLDGDTNGDYENINDTSKKDTAVTTLISHLDKVLTGGVLPSDYYTALKTHLMNINYSSTKNKKEALAIMRDAIRFIVTSSAYMIQK